MPYLEHHKSTSHLLVVLLHNQLEKSNFTCIDNKLDRMIESVVDAAIVLACSQ